MGIRRRTRITSVMGQPQQQTKQVERVSSSSRGVPVPKYSYRKSVRIRISSRFVVVVLLLYGVFCGWASEDIYIVQESDHSTKERITENGKNNIFVDPKDKHPAATVVNRNQSAVGWFYKNCTFTGDDGEETYTECRKQKIIANETIYSYDGIGNNAEHPLWGAKDEAKIRMFPPMHSYVDGIGTPPASSSLTNTEKKKDDISSLLLPSPSQLLTRLFSRITPPKVAEVRKRNGHNSRPNKLNQLLVYFGQFITHDISHGIYNYSDPMHIECDNQEEEEDSSSFLRTSSVSFMFCQPGQTLQHVPFFRNTYKDGYQLEYANGTVVNYPRLPISTRTAFLDLGHIYGQDEATVHTLRQGHGGLVRLTKNGLPPKEGRKFIIPVDEDVGKNPGMLCLLVIFLRYHNILAHRFAKEDPTLSDEELFQLARMENIATYQHIVEDKYIPSLLGTAVGEYTGYDPTTNPSIDVFFSTVAFRYGHSAISGNVRLLDASYQPLKPYDPVLLRDVFDKMEQWVDILSQVTTTSNNQTNTEEDVVSGIEPFLRGLSIEAEKNVDLSFVADMNVFTQMVTSMNIQRGRDLGVPYYNDVRSWLQLPRYETFEHLLGEIGRDADPDLATILSSLYNNNVNLLDAYVGALLETEFGFTTNGFVGHTMTESILDQFKRLRDGDSLWYHRRYSDAEIAKFPSLSEMVKMVFPRGEMDLFPDDSFIANSNTRTTDIGLMSLLDNTFHASWIHDAVENSIEITLTVGDKINGGFLGIGWGSKIMDNATIWFCTVDEVMDYTFPSSCSNKNSSYHDDNMAITASTRFFSCCIAPGKEHLRPECVNEDDGYYKLNVVNECLAEESTSVTILVPVCTATAMDDDDDNFDGSDDRNDCFDIGQPLDFIAAYSPSSQIHPHGAGRRAFGKVDFVAPGERLVVEKAKFDDFFALHGIYMLGCWLVVAPVSIFIARYMKTWSYRLPMHAFLMTIVESATFPLIISAYVAALEKKASEHRITGILIVCLFPLISFIGILRHFCLESGKTLGGLDIYFGRFHRFLGYSILVLSFWNCYTGLVRIGPNDTFVKFFTVNSVPMGYDFRIFGLFRHYLLLPWIALIIIAFALAEVYIRGKSGIFHRALREKGIWGNTDFSGIETMTYSSFNESTRHGKHLCIVDGYVVDLGDFIERHPGGRHILRFAYGTDITKELLGERDVDGTSHTHSSIAFGSLKSLVVARLEEHQDNLRRSGGGKSVSLRFSGGRIPHTFSDAKRRFSKAVSFRFRGSSKPDFGKEMASNNASFFQKATVKKFENMTPLVLLDDKPVVRLSVLVHDNWGPNTDKREKERSWTCSPGSYCFLRVLDKHGTFIERPQTPVRLERLTNGNTIYEFLISMVPGGKMSTVLQKMRVGETILVTKPKLYIPGLKKIEYKSWKMVMLFASGSGISSILQVIDYFLPDLKENIESKTFPTHGLGRTRIFLVWVLKDCFHNCMETLGLEERAEKSNGRLKWILIFANSPKNTLQQFGNVEINTKSGGVVRSIRESSRISVSRPFKKKTLQDSFASSVGQQHFLENRTSSIKPLQSHSSSEPVENTDWWKGGYMIGRIDHNLIEHLLVSTVSNNDKPSSTDFSSLPKLSDSDFVLTDLAEEKDSKEKDPEEGEIVDDWHTTFNNETVTAIESGSRVERSMSLDSGVYDDTLIAISGRPKFEEDIQDALKNLGLNENQILRFTAHSH